MKQNKRTQQPFKSTERKRAPWPFLTHNGFTLLPAKKFDPSKVPDAPF